MSDWNFIQRTWKFYIPAASIMAAGFLILKMPILAVILVAGGCFVFAAMYSRIVFRMTQSGENPSPNFKQVSAKITQKIPWLKNFS